MKQFTLEFKACIEFLNNVTFAHVDDAMNKPVVRTLQKQ